MSDQIHEDLMNDLKAVLRKHKAHIELENTSKGPYSEYMEIIISFDWTEQNGEIQDINCSTMISHDD